MLINMKEMLSVAKKEGFAVGAFNVADSNFFKTVVEAAEENNSPAIIAIHPNEFNYVSADFFEFVQKRLIASPIPFVLHLDHGANLTDVLKAISAGFTSVMIDGSLLPFEENIALTKKIVEVCHPLNISVEGELGTIGSTGTSNEGGSKQIIYTRACDVQEFTLKTKVDTLAVAIGTAHGIYPKGFEPKLRIDILKQITQVTDVLLVLHGGSANPDSEIEAAVVEGIQKVNISSDYKFAFFEKCKQVLNEGIGWDPDVVYPPCIAAAKDVVVDKMELFKSIDKAGFYK